MSKKGEAGITAEAYIQKYGGRLSKHAIGKLMAEERPDLYATDEYARQLVRYYCGQRGKASRTHGDNDNKFFGAYPEKSLDDEMFYDISARRAKILCLSDVHVPFHDKLALDTAINYGLKNGANTVLLNGDALDHWGESTHERELRQRDLAWDYEQYLDFLFELRCAFPSAKILFKMGNHEKRYERSLLRTHLRELLGIDHFQYEKVMKFDELQITAIPDFTTITVAGLNIIHGHEYRGSGGVNPARWLTLRTGESTLCGHFHRTSEHSTKSHRGDVTSYWSQGTLAQLSPRYMPYNTWNHGFSFIIKEGKMFHVKNKRINDGKIL